MTYYQLSLYHMAGDVRGLWRRVIAFQAIFKSIRVLCAPKTGGER